MRTTRGFARATRSASTRRRSRAIEAAMTVGAARSPWTLGGGVIVARAVRPRNFVGGLLQERPGPIRLPPSRPAAVRPRHFVGGLLQERPGSVRLPPSRPAAVRPRHFVGGLLQERPGP